MTKVGVLGAGAWGTTLANYLARAGHEVTLWAYEPEVVDSINRIHENPIFLPEARLEPKLRAVDQVTEAVRGAGLLVSAPPSHAAREVLGQVGSTLPPNAIVASATKGIEAETLHLMHQVASEVLPPHRFVALSGPSFASEVYQGQPTAVVAASTEAQAAATVQGVCAGGTLRVYSNQDVVGTELAGALKNVIAIAAGILAGLGLGHNARAALITRGLAEMTRLGLALGAEPGTFAGLAGMGDLILTACGNQSRNRGLGEALARGVALSTYQREHRSVAEGVNTAAAAVRLAQRHQVELPIATKVAEILFHGLSAKQAITQLMERTPKPEQWT